MALTDNLVSYYKLDESSGNASDSVGGLTLTNNSTVTYSAGKINNGAAFSGSNDLTTSSSYMASGSSGTISMWYKVTSGTGGILFQQRTSGTPFIQINFPSANKVGVTMYNGTVYNKVDGNSTANGNWHHVVGIFTSTYITLWVDGVDKGSTAYSSSNQWGSNSIFGTRSQGFVGMLDEIGVWNRALTSTEITTLYNSGNGLQYPFTGSLSTGNFFAIL